MSWPERGSEGPAPVAPERAIGGGEKRSGDRDWAAETTDSITTAVASVRAKTADPLERVARILVYGLLGVVVGLAALVLVAIAAVRALDVAIPGEVWSAHLVVGGIFVLGGLFLWRKRTVKTTKV